MLSNVPFMAMLRVDSEKTEYYLDSRLKGFP